MGGALSRARDWARRTAACGVMDFSAAPLQEACRGEYRTPVSIPWDSVPLRDKIDLLRAESERLHTDPRIVDWDASLWHSETETLYLTADGTRVHQTLSQLVPTLGCTANDGPETVSRTFGGRGFCRQGGIEVLDQTGFRDAAPILAQEALELLAAPNCPAGTMDLLLAPDQLILQVHESIGHPLELDRILGDERNYAGTSFVTPDMFGRYRYGSELLNVTFDPTDPGQFASYGFDDEGLPAHREHIIRDGVLMRGPGGTSVPAADRPRGGGQFPRHPLNRPPIDRMANLNLEPWESTFDDMVRTIEHGVFMQTTAHGPSTTHATSSSSAASAAPSYGTASFGRWSRSPTTGDCRLPSGAVSLTWATPTPARCWARRSAARVSRIRSSGWGTPRPRACSPASRCLAENLDLRDGNATQAGLEPACVFFALRSLQSAICA